MRINTRGHTLAWAGFVSESLSDTSNTKPMKPIISSAQVTRKIDESKAAKKEELKSISRGLPFLFRQQVKADVAI